MAGYRRAWETNDPDDIRKIFTEDAEYRTEPWVQPWRGHGEIVANWLERRDEPGSSTFTWSPVAVTDEVAVVQGETGYADGRNYRNLWIVRLSDDGRAREFTEWWMDMANPS